MKVDRVSNASDKVIDYQYEYYDANGNNNNRIRKVIDNVDSSFTTDYLYDRFNRLTHATASAPMRGSIRTMRGAISRTFRGRRSTMTSTRTARRFHQPHCEREFGGGPVTQTYDAAGNLTNDGSQSFVYDGASRLKQASGGTSSYGYDGDGRRVRVTDGTAVAYVYSSVLGQSVLEANSTGVQRAYVYAGNKLVAQQSTDGQFTGCTRII
ncbi:MAG: hypothetical protein U0X75_28965 [Acidobacteriota bacterium]